MIKRVYLNVHFIPQFIEIGFRFDQRYPYPILVQEGACGPINSLKLGMPGVRAGLLGYGYCYPRPIIQAMKLQPIYHMGFFG